MQINKIRQIRKNVRRVSAIPFENSFDSKTHKVFLVWGFFLVIGLFLSSLYSRRAQGQQVFVEDLTTLEILAFTSEEAQLSKIENQAVRVIQKYPENATAHYLLSHIMVRRFAKEPSDLYLLKQASSLAQQAIDLEPKSPVGYVAMAEILDVMNSPDRAIRILEESEAIGVKANWRFSFMRARLTAAEVGSARVLELLDKSLRFPETIRSIVVPHVVAVLQSEYHGLKLVDAMEEWNQKFPSKLFQLTKAMAFSEIGDSKSAMKTYELILAEDPFNREALINSAIVAYHSMKNQKLAIKNLNLALDRHQSTMPSSMLAMVHAHLGVAQLGIKDFVKAQKNFVLALELDPANVGILDFISRSCKESKSYKQLASLLDEVSLKFKGQGVYHALLGETLSEHLFRHEEAVKAFSNAIVLEPDRGDYYNGMGLAFYRNKKLTEALKLFSAATEIDPNDATARYNEACVLALLGRKEEAIATLAEAFSLDPRLVYTAQLDNDLEVLKPSQKFKDLLKEPSVHAASQLSH